MNVKSNLQTQSQERLRLPSYLCQGGLSSESCVIGFFFLFHPCCYFFAWCNPHFPFCCSIHPHLLFQTTRHNSFNCWLRNAKACLFVVNIMRVFITFSLLFCCCCVLPIEWRKRGEKTKRLVDQEFVRNWKKKRTKMEKKKRGDVRERKRRIIITCLHGKESSSSSSSFSCRKKRKKKITITPLFSILSNISAPTCAPVEKRLLFIYIIEFDLHFSSPQEAPSFVSPFLVCRAVSSDI